MNPESFVPETAVKEPPGETWRLAQENISSDRIDGNEAARQAVRLALGTERFRYVIYSWDYGAELEDLFGQPYSFVRPELERRIRDALSQDTRITGVDGFSFQTDRKSVHCTFTVRTIYGKFEEGVYVRNL